MMGTQQGTIIFDKLQHEESSKGCPVTALNFHEGTENVLLGDAVRQGLEKE